MAKKKQKKKKVVVASKQKKTMAKKAKNVKKVAKKKVVAKKKSAPKRKIAKKPIRGKSGDAELVSYGRRGLGAGTGGQSGDTQGLSGAVDVDSESVTELLEEGQSYEAEVVKGIEDAPDPDEGEIHTKEVLEDDVPREYDDQ